MEGCREFWHWRTWAFDRPTLDHKPASGSSLRQFFDAQITSGIAHGSGKCPSCVPCPCGKGFRRWESSGENLHRNPCQGEGILWIRPLGDREEVGFHRLTGGSGLAPEPSHLGSARVSAYDRARHFDAKSVGSLPRLENHRIAHLVPQPANIGVGDRQLPWARGFPLGKTNIQRRLGPEEIDQVVAIAIRIPMDHASAPLGPAIAPPHCLSRHTSWRRDFLRARPRH